MEKSHHTMGGIEVTKLVVSDFMKYHLKEKKVIWVMVITVSLMLMIISFHSLQLVTIVCMFQEMQVISSLVQKQLICQKLLFMQKKMLFQSS